MRPYDIEVAKAGHSESCAEHGGGDCTCAAADRCELCNAFNTFAHGHEEWCAHTVRARGGLLGASVRQIIKDYGRKK